MSPVRLPTDATGIYLPAELLLQDLLRLEVIRTEDWDFLAGAVHEELKALPAVATLLSRLVKGKLLTEYQAERISLGRLRELMLGNYRVLDRLGGGSMGVVYKAEHTRLGRVVAIKVVFPPADPRSNRLKRFSNEARLVARMNHPNIVAAHDAGGDWPNPDPDGAALNYFVMEFVPGEDLEEMVKNHGPLAVEKACDVIQQTASALGEAHKHNLVHRDIKPANIRVTPEGQAKLLDFGLARIFSSRMTQPGIVMGTLDYLAPEQARDSHEVDIRADIFSLGATLFWCLTGRVPFPTHGSVTEDLARRQAQAPPSARVWRPEVPAGLDAVLSRMMAPRVNDRYATPDAVLRALFPFLTRAENKTGPAPATMVPAAADHRHDCADSADSFRVLIVDDEPANRSLCRLLLEPGGIHCDEADNGGTALEKLREKPFDLVLLDIDMPVLSGTEVLKQLRADPPSPHLKITMFSGRASGDEMAEMLLAGADDYLTKPFSGTQLTARIRAALRLKHAQDRSGLLNQHLWALNHELEQGLQSRDSDLLNARNTLVLALAELVATRDQQTGAHLRRLQRYARCLAEEAAGSPAFAEEIDGNFIQLLECCAPLHDIGKVGVPDHILLKPGKLDAEERLIMESHTTLGAGILQKAAREYGFAAAFMQMACDIVRHHHEHFDGTGYPDRLAGDSIPLAARIVAIGDVYDALRSRRVYKPSLAHEDSIRLMTENSPGHFDPALLAAFERCADQFQRLFQNLTD